MDNQKTFWLVLAAVIIIFFVFFVSGNYNPSPQPQAAFTNTSPYASVSLEAWKFSGLFNENCAVGDEPFCAFYEGKYENGVYRSGGFKCGCRKITLLDYKAPTTYEESIQYKTIKINNQLYNYDVKEEPFCSNSNITREVNPLAGVPVFIPTKPDYSLLVNAGMTSYAPCVSGGRVSRDWSCACYRSDEVSEKMLATAARKNVPQFACPADAVLTNGEPFEVTPNSFIISKSDPITSPYIMDFGSKFALKATCPVTVSRFLTQSITSSTTTYLDDLDQLITYLTQRIPYLLELRQPLGF